MRQRLNDILNYNSDNRKFRPNWENLFSQLGKKYSLTGAQKLPNRTFLHTLLVLFLMVVGATGAWAQDYSGVYYIGTKGYNAGTPANNYYLCPTEGWAFFVSDGNVQGDPNGKPFLTTYKCKTAAYHSGDPSDAVWIIEKVPSSNLYYIKQASTGRYIVSNGAICNNPDRARVHLETINDPEDLDGKAQFDIYTFNGHIVIKSIGITDGDIVHANHSTHRWLTVNQGNQNTLAATNHRTDGPNDFKNTGGIICIYTENDVNAEFYLEKATIDPPTITNNFTASNTITITAAEGATIYYTIDGTTPTTSTTNTTTSGTGTTPISITIDETSDWHTIKAIAKSPSDAFPTAVRTYNLPILGKPVISVVENVVTITAADGASIYYTTDDTEATPSATPYSGTFSMGSATAIRAIATKPGYYRSAEAVSKPPLTVHYSSEMTEMNRSYILADDFISASSIGTSVNPFRGTIDGNLNTISGLDHALVAYADGAIIKNIILDNVSISGGTNVGAICNEATGDSRIYNCGILSGSVSGSGYVGGLVGLLDGTSRVINCYSYADVSGGSDVGGIVGYNAFASTQADLRTMVMNCMFYGDITGGTNVSPVYGGLNINNLHGGLNTYNYYSYDEATSFKDRAESASKKYNCALAVEEKNLNRFEFYRLLLNSNKKLAAIYATGSAEHAGEMAKWVLETADRTIDTPKPYPILKAQGYYPSIINYDAENAPATASERNKGGKLGKTLSVSIISKGSNAPVGASITNGSLTLIRTDKDFDRFNYNYDKVQLPYYDEVGEGNYTEGKVVTGWKITNITTIAGDPYTSGNYDYTKTYSSNQSYFDAPNYNFADRKSSNKDLYSVSGRVFSQGAYFDVPYGVTSITIEPYWGNAAYVADEYYDVVYQLKSDNKDYIKQEVTQLGTQVGGGAQFNGQTIYTTISSALGTLSGSTVYDNAVVLVGNLHQNDAPSKGSKAFTLMSVDMDNDHEPDYSMIYHHNGRQQVCPIRFDFLNIPGTAQAQKPNGSSLLLNFTIFKTKGWFEITNTALAYSNQVEYENTDGSSKADSPLILLGGDFEQFVSTQRTAVSGKTIYIHVGSNVRIKSFGLGTHSDGKLSTPHVPVSVTGGEYEGFYLTGTYNPDATEKADNAECYISSGYFKEAAGACQEPINGNVQWQIYNADIDNFFGGGINDARPIKGTITTDIFNSYVGTFCGGPKFGNMQTDKNVTTRATGCTFDEYFGAGYGGLSYSRQKYFDESGYNFATKINPYISERGKYYDGKSTNANSSKPDYGYKGPGVATDCDYEFFVWSSGVTGARVYVKFASFSLAKCNDVSSTLTGCTINRHFYGGGSLGEVTGKATSVLDGCTVHGNVFGGGFSASLPTIEVRDGDYSTKPNFNSNSGIFEPGVFSATTTFEWKNATEAGVTLTNGGSGSDLTTNHYIYTDVDLNVLGQVGETDLTITGNTIVEGKIFDENGLVTETTGGVFGGGDQSAVNGNTKVDIQNTEGTDGVLNVFGGGNTADVEGNTVVTMTGGKVKEDVYGGGKGETTVVNGNVSVTIGAMDGEGNLSGTGTVSRNVYGGSAFGAVNATKGDGGTLSETEGNKRTLVNIYGGTVKGSVFGGGLGKEESGTPGDPGYVTPIAALNFGNDTIMVKGGTVETALYGGSNVNGVLKKDATITLLGGTVGTPREGEAAIKDAVFGGGKGQPTLVNGDVTVNVGTLTTGPTYTGTAAIHGNVYGGSALGNTNASKTGSDPIVYDAAKKTYVNLYAGTITGNVFGGGLGQKNGENGATSDIEAFVGGDVYVTLDGAKLGIIKNGTIPLTGQIFGCNNLNGSPKGHVKVWVKRTVDSDKSDETAFESRTTYDVAAVYGGGNKANYNPTKATGSAADKEEAFAEVIIEGCDATSIEYVYGGGNAAAVPATDVTVKGTYIIDYLFGGGNGAGAGNPGADVGIINKAAYAADPTTGTYGTGKAVTRLIGGKIRTVFGGSNTKGNVRGGTKITMPQKPDGGASPEYCSVLEVKNIYGAGNEAEQDGAVDLVLGCVTGMENVYGGAKNANVAGGINLTITSGHFSKVFGGNNESGTIQGPITLNIEETACDPITIDELYIGGYLAPYSVYGYYEDAEDGNKLKPRTSLTDHTADAIDAPASPYSASQWYANPVLNVISCTSIGNVFGGGYGSGAVLYGSPTVNMNMVPGDHAAEIDRNGDSVAEGNAHALGTIGNIYGGGSAADVYGDATINIGTAETVTLNSRDDDLDTDDVNEHTPSVEGIRIIGNVYGGGLSASIHGSTQVNIGTVSYTTEGYEGVSITGNVFGGGQGETTKVTGNVAVVIGEKTTGETPTYNGNATITGDIYGGSALGSVNADGSPLTATVDATTTVTLNIGTVTGSIYGGGYGYRDDPGDDSDHDILADVYGEVTVTINNGTVSESVYGCNNLNGSPKDDVNVVIAGGTITGNVYGGGNQAAYTGEDELSVTMSGGTVTDVFGGGLGETADVTGNTTVTVSGGSVINDIYGGGSLAEVFGGTSVTLSGEATVGRDIYGGGSLADVQNAVTVALNGGTVGRDVYGGGALASTNTSYTSGDSPATSVTLAGATITGNLYGGGLGRLDEYIAVANGTTLTSGNTYYTSDAGAGEFTSDGTEVADGTNYFEHTAAVAANVGGPVTVTVNSGSANNVFGCNNINGAPQVTAAVTIAGGEIAHNVYGGGNLAAFAGNASVTMSNGTVNENVFGGGLGSTAIVTGNTSVSVSGGTIKNDVYGGGSQADVTGSVNVLVTGGKIIHDIYGGGALANTNTANWTLGAPTPIYVDLTSVVTVGTSSVYGLFTESGGVYTEVTDPDAKAAAATNYYERRMLPGTWAYGKDSDDNTTTVTLTGGIIGNVYGGGLGDSTTPVYVFGDITVNVNKPADITAHGGAGAAFTYNTETPTIAGVNYTPVPMTGNVFGCNNINGTPMGDVTVGVYSTRQIDGSGNYVAGHSPNGVITTYEIQAVYGGGNQADYLPAAGKGTYVIIDGCGETSISNVYGGGSAASVPATDVVVWGSYDIGYAFGGGNGFFKIKKNGVWTHNDGANVNGLAKIICHGGKIGELFGGSDAKGDCRSTSTSQEQSGSCPLVLTKLYGAGKEADVDGSVNVVISACTEGNSEIEYVCGGSYKAHISGDVTMTITSGYFKTVFGGNDQRGGIGGNITVNIEETENCEKPIIIQNLVGGSNRADYPGNDKTDTPFPIDPANPRKIEVNVKSATRIDNIFGGSFLAEANANTEVNINMNRGNKSGQTGVPLPSYYGEPEAVLPSNISNVTIGYEEVTGLTVGSSSVVGYYLRSGDDPNYTYTPAAGLAQSGATYCKQTITGDIAASIGTIGNVYGGGNEGLIRGNSTVNIGTSPTVPIMERDPSTHEIHADKDGSGKIEKIYYTDEKVLGTHIDGDVFGGGFASNVTGDATVNYCTTDYSAIDYSGTTGFEGFSIGGSIYGGGSAADVHGNTSITMAGGYVFDGVYGGGLHGSVGTVTEWELPTGHASHAGCVGGIPTAYADNTGKCTVVVSGGQIGPVETALAKGGMKNTDRFFKKTGEPNGPVDYGFIFGAGRGEETSAEVDVDTDFRTYVKETDVTVGGTAFIMASVYGGGENGRVAKNTHVKIQGNCQIGCGEGKVTGSGTPADPYIPQRYTDDQWSGEDPENFTECASWEFESPYLPYDPMAKPGDTDASTTGTDGHTYYGSVFGGGSGYYPHENPDGTHEWLRSAGQVNGNTLVEITGGHILTCVYGGNETTDVAGKCTIIMTGGTLGVPRTDENANKRPVTCYLFGAGKGDQRTRFNNWTNVANTTVVVGGTSRIFGSVFGGGEDGHVLGDTQVYIGANVSIDLNDNGDTTDPGETFAASDDVKIGTTGTSYIDGNVFGGGRGFSGMALTAGSIRGNTSLTIGGGTILGSVYGGGRLASVGIDMTPATLENGDPNPYYGLLIDDTDEDGDGTIEPSEKHGHITVNITGGTIGNNVVDAEYGGNVFGAGMGRNTFLDGSVNPLWPKLATTTVTDVTIGGTAVIKKNVYGGGEFGIVRNQATVNVTGGTINGNVFGAGRGSIDSTPRTTITAGGYESIPTLYYTFTPMTWNGVVSGNTFVNISGGWVKRNVYGGGEYASVGLINFNVDGDGKDFNNVTKHDDPTKSFALSWPYDFQYIAAAPTDDPAVGGGTVGGKATVNITGGRIGITGKDVMDDTATSEKEDNGDVYGGSKGVAGDRYTYGYCANVKETSVTVNLSSSATPANYKSGVSFSAKGSNDCIAGSVYGGGENGHVMQDAAVTLTNGLIGHAIYGGGKGKDTYRKNLTKVVGSGTYEADVYSITAGKVYGNTSVTMNGGYVVRNIYGGGNMASVGKGNYAGGTDDFYAAGYGEKIESDLWSNTNFMNSGKTTVLVTGGTVGYIDPSDASKTLKDGMPYGNIFGGCRGQAAAEVADFDKNPNFFVGYVNQTNVTIGTKGQSSEGAGGDEKAPRIYGSVYGGGQDGHVRRETELTLYSGEVGSAYTSAGAATSLVGTADLSNAQWLHRGNVYGGGSGISQYEFDYNGDGDTNTNDGSLSYYGYPVKEQDYSSSAGSVTHCSTVNIDGGIIHRNVYGGGSLASVSPPATGSGDGPYPDDTHGKGKMSVNKVVVSGGNISNTTDASAGYGGNVFGASRGMAGVNQQWFALTTETQVSIQAYKTAESAFDYSKNPVIANNVYGGGELGTVKQNTMVQLTGGEIMHDAYGGGKGIKADVGGVAADVGGNTTVLLNQDVGTTQKGCIVNKVYGCNDLNGTPKGHPLVHVYATQHKTTGNISTKVGPPTYAMSQGKDEGYMEYLTKLAGDTEDVGATQTGGLAADDPVITAATTLLTSLSTKTEEQLTDGEKTAITNAAKNIISALEAMHDYDVEAVYGGSDLADYVPTDATSDDATKKANARTEVIIEGCEVTSIRQVYGGSNAASTPATDVKVESCYIIDELFGGGNGKDNYTLEDGKWYENPGANVGYKDFMHYVKDDTQGTGVDEENKYLAITNTSPDATTPESRQDNYSIGEGEAKTTVTGGHIHKVYGGSNEKGNIRKTALSQYQKSGTCPLITDETYGGSKNAEIDAEIEVVLDCMEGSVGDFFGGSTNANINSNVTLNITNGTYGRIFGGNNKAGTINGDITINIEEKGCTPIIIGELYGGGYLAPYSIYGFQKDGEGHYVTVPDEDEEGNAINSYVPLKKDDTGALDEEHKHRDPYINIISATEIGTIYGGGYKAKMVASPHINVNMTTGRILATYADRDPSYSSYEVESTTGDLILPIGTIGNIFGGGNKADIIGNTHVEIGTGTHHNVTSGEIEPITPERNAANITGNVYGGGKMGHVGDFTLTDGKPTSCAEGTGICSVTISNGDIGPNDMNMWHLNASGNVPADDKPDDSGHVFGAGQGTNDPADDNKAFVDSTEVIINGTAWVKGSVFGGGENGHVLHNTGVKIQENCQIGNGHILVTDEENNNRILVNRGVNRRYTAEEWTAGHLIVGVDDFSELSAANKTKVEAQFAASLPECDSWLYGKKIENFEVKDYAHHAPYDKFEGTGGYDAEGGLRVASSGRAFNGSVFGGGSGYFPYAAGEWNPKAGQVEGDSWVEVTGGHIMTSLFGGCEMSSMLGDAHVKMTGGTVGVPRTLDEIAAHPVTCYVFGGGKGEGRTFLDGITNVEKDAYVTIGGDAWVYGSVFGGAEDGWINGNIHLNILNGTKKTVDGKEIQFPLIGTWGTSYVDGNIFGGGRGYDGKNKLAGRVGGNINVDIKGGTMLGSIYGGGRLGSVGINTTDAAMQAGDTHGHITVNIEGGTIGNNHEYKYIAPETTINDSYRSTNHIPFTEFDDNNRLLHTKGGNVFASSMGRRAALGGGVLTDWTELGRSKSTKLTISGANTRIMGNVYGGGEFGAVVGYHTKDTKHYGTEISITGGTIGTQIKDGAPVKYTFGSVYGGGYGTVDEVPNATTNINVQNLGALIADSTYISMSGGHVWASVYGGGEVAAVGGNTNVNISGGEIGKDSVRADGNVLFGGATMGNVYGSGKGTTDNPLVGVVKGNTTINISAGAVEGEPYIYHNVYGGGALASVGAFHPNGSMPDTDPPYVPSGVPYGWTENDGIARINITGGTIGISGHDNGMVNGAGRGDVALPNEAMTLFGNPVYKDPYDRLGWVNQTYVNIGTKGAGTGPKVKGSVYGGGENGHNNSDATVNVYSGTIGILENETWGDQHHESRGNVYGAGCGTDTYWDDEDSDGVKDPGETHHNPWSGIVCGNTYVNIWGGQVVHNVYGGGSMGSVGGISNDPTALINQHHNPANGFAYSWPTILEFTPNSGKATVNIYGGRIGTTGSDNGDVFGGPKGEAGDPYDMAHMGTLLETEVNIHYKDGEANYTPSDDKIEIAEKIDEEDGKKKYSLKLKDTEGGIAGSVYGGSEEGHVYGNTQVNIISGYIGHAIYGGGKGKGTYIPSGGTKAVPSITAGKVYGNTNIAMSGGHVLRNIYGGGNLGSIGKGNYAGGADDYNSGGYGETLTGNLWTSTSDGDDAWQFLHSGKTTVEITGGIVGFMPQSGTVVKPLESDATTFGTVIGGDNDELKQKVVKVCSKDDLPTGNVFGGCRGQATANVANPTLAGNPDFFLGYVNETEVTIGDGSTGPRIYGSVYGGGQDGHVRRDASVTINKGEIGIPYNAANKAIFGTNRDNLNWLHRGNVYGSGSGIGMYDTDDDGEEDTYSNSSGSVTHNTTISVANTINGVAGTQDSPGNVIYRNVYGGGSLASVGPPKLDPSRADFADKVNDATHGRGWWSTCLVTILGTIGYPTDYDPTYGGEVYGASRGDETVGEGFANSVWTKVLIKNGANILGNVFGGGDAGKVQRDSEVIVGD